MGFICNEYVICILYGIDETARSKKKPIDECLLLSILDKLHLVDIPRSAVL